MRFAQKMKRNKLKTITHFGAIKKQPPKKLKHFGAIYERPTISKESILR